MCKWGESLPVRVFIDKSLSYKGKSYWREFLIDSCIAPLVDHFQRSGIDMLASCCGHGKADGRIDFAPIQGSGVPPVRVKFIDGTYFLEQLPADEWMTLGHARRPQTRWQWFRYHVLHGLMMGYPFFSVIRYAQSNSKKENI